MIVMVVAQEHYVDGRQISEPHTWFRPPSGADPPERTRALAPDRIREQIASHVLNQQRRMIDEGHSTARSFYTSWRFCFGRFFRRSGPGRGTARQLPPQNV